MARIRIIVSRHSAFLQPVAGLHRRRVPGRRGPAGRLRGGDRRPHRLARAERWHRRPRPERVSAVWGQWKGASRARPRPFRRDQPARTVLQSPDASLTGLHLGQAGRARVRSNHFRPAACHVQVRLPPPGPELRRHRRHRRRRPGGHGEGLPRRPAAITCTCKGPPPANGVGRHSPTCWPPSRRHRTGRLQPADGLAPLAGDGRSQGLHAGLSQGPRLRQPTRRPKSSPKPRAASFRATTSGS